MSFEMPHFEVRYHDKAEWEEISDENALESIQEAFGWVTPAIQDMIQGKRILTPDAMYRIKCNISINQRTSAEGGPAFSRSLAVTVKSGSRSGSPWAGPITWLMQLGK